MEAGQNPNFRALTIRLAGYGRRIFAEFGVGGPEATVSGVGLSVEDFVSNVLSEYLEGRLEHQAARGELFSLLATALRNDVVDALRKAAHAREESRSPLARDSDGGGEPPGLDEMPARVADPWDVVDHDRYRERVDAAFAEEPELAEIVKAILDLGLSKPRDIAESLGISTTEYQNRKKRLQRRLVEYKLVEVQR